MIPIQAPLLSSFEFKDIEFAPMDHEMYWFDTGDEGEQALYRLPNGVYVSIVRHRFSYGGDRGQYEIMTFTDTSPNGVAVEGITDGDGIIGFLEPRDVGLKLKQLAGATP